MTRKLLFALCLLLLGGNVYAETKYVVDQIVITLRSGQSNQHQILRTLPSGTKMEVLETSDKYSRVRLTDGTEGWVLNQYMTATPIAKHRLASVQKKLAGLEAENIRLKEELVAASSKEGDISTQYAKLKKADEKLNEELDRLRSVAAKPLQLKNENTRLKKALLDIENEHELVQQENQMLRDSAEREWFLTGAGVIILGIILGLIAPSLRPRKKSSWSSL
ncbi:MAG TPA: TIGR04211 family SH3 domain-containing protein [Chromatiales bacterium]|nr:TIGR04211 family SH3 domain-containing protein [Chromatiales bacterium]HEX22166.1 TIGR04211 family SH3 domain-containing protein [Chromatiales bacterium]